MTRDELRRRIAAKPMHCPTFDMAVAAASLGRLYDVDTQGAGHDALVVADSAELAVWEIAEFAGFSPEESGDRPRGWTVERVEIA